MTKNNQNGFARIILLVILLMVLGLGALLYSRMGTIGYDTFSPEILYPDQTVTANKFPSNFSECKEVDNLSGGPGNLECSIWYNNTEEEADLYTQCIEKGGFNRVWECSDGPCSSCFFHFYNPDFTLPTNYQECKDSVDQDTGETGQYDSCIYNIGLTMTTDRNAAEILFEQCKELGGLSDLTGCSNTFFSEE